MTKTIYDNEAPATGQQLITPRAFIYQLTKGEPEAFLPKKLGTKGLLPGILDPEQSQIKISKTKKASKKKAAKKQKDEEIKIGVIMGEPFYSLLYDNEKEDTQTIEVVFLATFRQNFMSIITNLEDQTDFRWFTQSQFKKTITTNPKISNNPEVDAIKKGFKCLRTLSLPISPQ